MYAMRMMLSCAMQPSMRQLQVPTVRGEVARYLVDAGYDTGPGGSERAVDAPWFSAAQIAGALMLKKDAVRRVLNDERFEKKRVGSAVFYRANWAARKIQKEAKTEGAS